MRRQQVEQGSIGRTVFGYPAAEHDTLGSGLPHTATAIDELVVVEVGQGLGFQHQRPGVHAIGVLQHIEASAEDALLDALVLHHSHGLCWMDIADKGVGLVGLAIAATGSHDATILFEELLHLGTTDDLATHLTDVIDQRTNNETTVALQTPAALDKAFLAVGKGKEGE